MSPDPAIGHDYRSAMQAAALGYLQQHRDQYLTSEDLLFNSCVSYLVNAMDVPLFLAQTVAQRAWNTLFTQREPAWLSIDFAAGDRHTAYLVDLRENLRYPVPARLLPQHLLQRQPKHP